MADVNTWDPGDDNNNKPPPDGWPEFMLPSQVNNSARMMMGATRRMYDTLVAGTLVLPYLKLAGGAGGQTVTGPVTFAGITAAAITSNGTINAVSTISTTGAISASGNISGGSISTGGALAAGSVNAGPVTAGPVNAASYDMASVALARVNGTATRLYDRADNPCLILDSNGNNYYLNGTHNFNNRASTVNFATVGSAGLTLNVGSFTLNGGGSFTMSGGGNLSCSGTAGITGNLNVAGDISAGTHVIIHDPAFGLFWEAGTNNRLQYFAPAANWVYQASNGWLYWANATGMTWVMRDDRFCYASNNAVGGQGAYVNMSDRRFKQDIEPAAAGLPEVLALNPMTFRREAGARLELGFIAQDVQDVLPAAVMVAGVELPDGTGGLGDPEPTLGLMSEAVVAALVGAVKTLDQRLTAGGL